ncbi:MAG: hypothetical protein ACKVS8_04615 [Phycisphaerales bacterium]
MILFAIYAVVVWWMAMRHRRTPMGFAIAALCALPMLLAARYVPALATFGVSTGTVPTTPGRGLEGMQILLWAEAAVVAGVSLFIVCLPRPPRGRHCHYCWYDLSGLDTDTDLCPECGTPRRGYGQQRTTPVNTKGPSAKTQSSKSQVSN